MGWNYRPALRASIAAFAVTLAASHAGAQQGDISRQLMFAPAELGLHGSFEPRLSSTSHDTAVPLPPKKPVRSIRRTGAPAEAILKAAWPKDDLGQGDRPVSLATPQAPAIDLSPRVDVGGVSFGLEAGRGNDGGSSGNLLSPEARNPVPTDPTLAPQRDRAKIPYVGLSLSAPTH